MDAVGAEAKAFEVGISYARDVGVAEFILEGDSLIISHALCEVVNNPRLLHLLVQLSMVFYLPATIFDILKFSTLEDKVIDCSFVSKTCIWH